MEKKRFYYSYDIYDRDEEYLASLITSSKSDTTYSDLSTAAAIMEELGALMPTLPSQIMKIFSQLAYCYSELNVCGIALNYDFYNDNGDIIHIPLQYGKNYCIRDFLEVFTSIEDLTMGDEEFDLSTPIAPLPEKFSETVEWEDAGKLLDSYLDEMEINNTHPYWHSYAKDGSDIYYFAYV